MTKSLGGFPYLPSPLSVFLFVGYILSLFFLSVYLGAHYYGGGLISIPGILLSASLVIWGEVKNRGPYAWFIRVYEEPHLRRRRIRWLQRQDLAGVSILVSLQMKDVRLLDGRVFPIGRGTRLTGLHLVSTDKGQEVVFTISNPEYTHTNGCQAAVPVGDFVTWWLESNKRKAGIIAWKKEEVESAKKSLAEAQQALAAELKQD